MTPRNRSLSTLFVFLMLTGFSTTSTASPMTAQYDFGAINLVCASEGAACPQDVLPGTPSVAGNVYVDVFNGGYRAGGRVTWDFNFDPSPFASISSMSMQVDVVGLYGLYPGNIGPGGQLGNFFAIDGVPFFAFLTNTDGRDSHVFAIPILTAGAHQFTVQVYDPAFSPGGNFEGWGGVDFARLSVSGEDFSGQVTPEPASMLLLGTGLLALRRARRRPLP